MSSQRNEYAFESYVEEILLTQSGYEKGSVAKYDKELALFPSYIISFIKITQPKLWDSMYSLQGDIMESDIIQSLKKELALKGMLDVLRHGFKYRGKRFFVAYFKPAHNMSDDVVALYNANILTVTRQVPCHHNDNSEMDLTIALNGLPIVTIELKNPATGQNFHHAIKQYREDRNPAAPLFKFKERALVHFAVDTEEVHMTTKLEKDKTFFLPFNRGSDPGNIKCGAGNPIYSSGYKTGYFFEEVLKKDSLIDIFGSYMFIEIDKRKKETMIFPRYHQLDAVRLVTSTAKDEGVGFNYLIQHSAGSGKTKSIAWLSHRLASLHNSDDNVIFDSVIVITDRNVLDKQLQDAIFQIEHKDGVVKCIDNDSAQLAEAMVDGTKIIVTTLQKFPFVISGLLKVAGADSVYHPDEESKRQAKEWENKIANKKYAVVVDEAHSSQTGESVRELKAILGSDIVLDEDSDWEDGLNAVMASRMKQKSISFFAFTATPKGKTLQLFGRIGKSGKPEAMHLYSMRQAIEEKFILDVLKHYTEYHTFYKIASKIEEEKEYSKKKGMKKIARSLKMHPTNINQKVEIIIEHFKNHVKYLLDGTAKAMVVTDSRLQAVKYFLAFKRYIDEHGYNDIRALVAFSGEVIDPETDEKYTEPKLNIDIKTNKNISEKQLPEKFSTLDYRILLVANKYQTGFDEPRLCAMYVDKRLDGVQAVQTLSRLNRCFLGKEEPFVLDFVNKPEDIYTAFKPFYDKTELDKQTDPMHLETLKTELDKYKVYSSVDLDEFASIYYKPKDLQKPSDHAKMESVVLTSKDKYSVLDKEEQDLFYNKLKSFVNLYSFVSQIITYSDEEWEKLYIFSRHLLPHLSVGGIEPPENPQENIMLTHLRNQKIAEHNIDLSDGESITVSSPSDVGTKKAEDKKVPLSILIQTLNERFGTDFTDEDRLFFEQILQKAQQHDEVVRKAKTNSYDKFELGIKEIIKNIMMQRIQENDDIVSRYLDDDEFQKIALTLLASEMYGNINQSSEN